MPQKDEMMLIINHLGWAKIKFRKWANYSCRNQMWGIRHPTVPAIIRYAHWQLA